MVDTCHISGCVVIGQISDLIGAALTGIESYPAANYGVHGREIDSGLLQSLLDQCHTLRLLIRKCLTVREFTSVVIHSFIHQYLITLYQTAFGTA